MNRNEIIEKLNNKLSDKRLEHSIGVEYTAANLAYVYNVDIDKARQAGLLHDCAKYLSTEDKLKKAEKHKIDINEYERKNPDLLHAKLGAYYAKKKYGVQDEDVLSSIKYHTTGRPNMTMLEKIIYVSDFIEPNRKDLPILSQIRKKAYEDIDIAIYMILENTLSFLKDKDSSIDTITMETYNFYRLIKSLDD